MIGCPNGHRFRFPPVRYGDPTPEAMERAKRGEIVLGGCMPDLPVERPCPKCGRVVVVSELVSGDPTGVDEGTPDRPF